MRNRSAGGPEIEANGASAVIQNAEDVRARMDRLGVQTVREMVSSGRWPANYHALATTWLDQKDKEERERTETHRAEAVVVAQRSNELARSATNAAREATDVARSAKDAAMEVNRLAIDANDAAREANSIAHAAARTARNNSIIAILALIGALIAIAISIVGTSVIR